MDTKDTKDVCFLCENPVDVKFIPCGHAIMCSECAQRAKKCPRCKEAVVGMSPLEVVCVMCNEEVVTVTMKPCGHQFCAECSRRMKICFYCHTEIIEKQGLQFKMDTKDTKDVCFLCENPVDVKFIPCGHAIMCSECTQRAKKCPRCKEAVVGMSPLEVVCVMCNEEVVTVTMKPCGHQFCAECSRRMKICFYCHTEIIEKQGLPLSEEETRKVISAALKHAKVFLKQRKVLLVGVNGTGKSSLLRLLLKEEPLPNRQSTPCAERALRAVRVDSATLDLRRMGPTELKAALAKAMRAFTSKHESTTVSFPEPSSKTPTSPKDGPVSSDESILKEEPVNLGDEFSSDESEKEPANLDHEFSKLIRRPYTEEDFKENVDWTYIIDTGGQPQFMEILPNLLRGTCLVICVFKLSEKFDACPMIEYYEDGKPIGCNVQSTRTNRQFLKHLIGSFSTEENIPHIIFVGTHHHQYQQQEQDCNKETMDEKENIINEIVPKGRVFLYQSKVIHPIDAVSHKKDNPEKVAKTIRDKILSYGTEEELPLQHYMLELKLEEIADSPETQVLEYETCWSVAKEVHFTEEDSFKESLQHLSDLNILSYYPNILPEVVFSTPQVLMDMITELVKLYLECKGLKESTSSQDKITGEIKSNLTEEGIITRKVLDYDRFKRYYNKSFSASHLVELFKHLLIFADLGDGTYLMPCLLPWLKEEDLPDHRVTPEGTYKVPAPVKKGEHQYLPDDGVTAKGMHKGKGQDPYERQSAFAPLILPLPDGPRNGLFCSLISSLISTLPIHKVSTSKDYTSEAKVPVCLKRNCVQFEFLKHHSFITLIDSIGCFEVHVKCSPEYKNKSELAKVVCDTLRLGLKKAASTIGYNKLKTIKKSFFCLCRYEDLHLPNLIKEDELCCNKNPHDPVSKSMIDEQKIWLSDGEETLDIAIETQEHEEGGGAGGSEERAGGSEGSEGGGGVAGENEEGGEGGGRRGGGGGGGGGGGVQGRSGQANRPKVLESDLAYLSGLPVAAEWDRLGLHLGVPNHQLDTIKANHAGQPSQCEHCLYSMFNWWLKNSDSCTPKQLAMAFSTIGRRDLARSISKKYMYDLPNTISQIRETQEPVGATGGEEKEDVKSPSDREPAVQSIPVVDSTEKTVLRVRSLPDGGAAVQDSQKVLAVEREYEKEWFAQSDIFWLWIVFVLVIFVVMIFLYHVYNLYLQIYL